MRVHYKFSCFPALHFSMSERIFPALCRLYRLSHLRKKTIHTRIRVDFSSLSLFAWPNAEPVNVCIYDDDGANGDDDNDDSEHSSVCLHMVCINTRSYLMYL